MAAGSMTQEAAGNGGRDVWRVAASGDPVELTLPAVLGDFRWYGNTRFSGPRLARQFFLAPAGEHRAIADRLLPGGRQTRKAMRGYDAVVFEAADRSDSALVLAGPYHEATTWFGGPAPTLRGSSVCCGRSGSPTRPAAPSLVPASDMLVRQSDVALIGRSARSVLVVRRAAEMLPTLPEWAGLDAAGRRAVARRARPGPRTAATGRRGRAPVALRPRGPDARHGPRAARARVRTAPLPVRETQVVDALSVLTGRWAG